MASYLASGPLRALTLSLAIHTQQCGNDRQIVSSLAACWRSSIQISHADSDVACRHFEVALMLATNVWE